MVNEVADRCDDKGYSEYMNWIERHQGGFVMGI